MFARIFRANSKRLAVRGIQTETKKGFFAKENLPVPALIIGCVAFSFQVGVLYPWHEQLSEQFEDLQATTHYIAGELETKMEELMALEEDIRANEARILEREEEILKWENKILTKLEKIVSQAEAKATKSDE